MENARTSRSSEARTESLRSVATAAARQAVMQMVQQAMQGRGPLMEGDGEGGGADERRKSELGGPAELARTVATSIVGSAVRAASNLSWADTGDEGRSSRDMGASVLEDMIRVAATYADLQEPTPPGSPRASTPAITKHTEMVGASLIVPPDMVEMPDHPDVYSPTPYLNGPRHEFLKRCVPMVNERVLSRVVDRIMDRDDPRWRHRAPPLLKLESALPNVYAPHVDVTRSHIAFGRRALPKLKREMESGDSWQLRQAVNSVSDLVRDPEKAYEAVRVGIPSEALRLLLSNDAFVRERAAAIIETLASQATGREALVADARTLAYLQRLCYDQCIPARLRGALALFMLARFRHCVRDMEEETLVPRLLALAATECIPEILRVHLDTLELLLQHRDMQELAVGLRAIPVFQYLVGHRDAAVAAAAFNCLECVLRCKAGREEAEAGDMALVFSAVDMLDSPHPEVRARAAAALMQMTTSESGKRAIDNRAVDKLLKLSKQRSQPTQQLNVLRTLINACEDPYVRGLLRQQLPLVEGVDPGADEFVARAKKQLIDSIQWEP